jgi:hypothetical protein
MSVVHGLYYEKEVSSFPRACTPPSVSSNRRRMHARTLFDSTVRAQHTSSDSGCNHLRWDWDRDDGRLCLRNNRQKPSAAAWTY